MAVYYTDKRLAQPEEKIAEVFAASAPFSISTLLALHFKPSLSHSVVVPNFEACEFVPLWAGLHIECVLYVAVHSKYENAGTSNKLLSSVWLVPKSNNFQCPQI